MLFTIVKLWKQPDVHHEWTKDRGSVLSITTTKYYSAIKMKCWRMLQCGWTTKALRSVEEARHNRSHTACFHSYEISRAGKPIDTESSLEAAKGIGRNREWLLSGLRSRFGGMTTPSGSGTGQRQWLYNIVSVLNATDTDTSKWLISRHVNFTSI